MYCGMIYSREKWFKAYANDFMRCRMIYSRDKWFTIVGAKLRNHQKYKSEMHQTRLKWGLT